LNKQNFLNIVRNPTGIGAHDIAGLEEVVASFPFCQAAHLLIAKGLRDYGSMHAEQKLKKAAAYSINRKRFKEIIQQDSKTAKDIQEKPEQIIGIKSAEEALPTVNRIIEEQKSEVKTEKRKYDEIEKNLKLIEFFKSEANKQTPEPVKKIKEETVSSGIPITNTQPSDAAAEAVVTDTLTNDREEAPHFIYSSRLEDVLLQELEIDSVHHKSDAGLLLDYLDYIYENKLGKMRDKKKQKEIIEKFINADPVIPTLKPHALPENQEDLASGSSRINRNPISETFARILSLQGKKDKAIEIYEQLILKVPEKKAYFAAEIEKLKK
jgi:tetratricopeptide (TPR) repeat protein